MPADRKDLERRLAQCKDSDTVRGLVLNAVFDLVRAHLGEEAARACDPQKKATRTDFFSYPVVELLAASFDAVDRLEGKLGGVEKAWHELGRSAVAGFLSSVVGRTALALAGRDPRRLMSAAPASYRTAASYGERKIEWRGEKSARMTIRRDFMVAEYHRGIILTALRATDARSPRVEARALGLLDSEYDLSWG